LGTGVTQFDCILLELCIIFAAIDRHAESPFCCSPKGAEASAAIYSIIEAAKENRFKPFEYLKYILETLPNIAMEQYPTLLPWSKELPDFCRLKEPGGSDGGKAEEPAAAEVEAWGRLGPRTRPNDTGSYENGEVSEV